MRPGVRLGVDVGSVRVGLAVSDPRAVLATPLRTVRREPGDPAYGPGSVREVAQAARELEVVEVVVGLPRTLSGGEGPAAATTRRYAARLAALVRPVPVRLVDERLTTVDAHRTLRDSGMSGRSQRAVVDQAAAVLILQTALDAEQASGQPPGEVVGALSPEAGTGAAPGAPGAARKPRKPRTPRPRRARPAS